MRGWPWVLCLCQCMSWLLHLHLSLVQPHIGPYRLNHHYQRRLIRCSGSARIAAYADDDAPAPAPGPSDFSDAAAVAPASSSDVHLSSSFIPRISPHTCKSEKQQVWLQLNHKWKARYECTCVRCIGKRVFASKAQDRQHQHRNTHCRL